MTSGRSREPGALEEGAWLDTDEELVEENVDHSGEE
jgi:hypothetical protein